MSDANGYHEEEILGKAYDSHLMKRLMNYVRPYAWLVVVAVIALLLVAALQTSMAFVTRMAVDEYITPGVGEGFGQVAFLYMAIVVLLMVASYAQIYSTMYLGQKVQHDVRMEAFGKLQQLHLGYFDRNPVGRMVTRVTNDVNALNELFSSGVVNIIGDIAMLVLYVAALFWVNWKLALVTFVSLPLLLVASFLFRSRARDAYRMVRLKLARMNAFVQEHITGMTLIQLFTQENRTFNRFDTINTDLRGAHHRSVLYYASFYPTVEIIGALSLGLLLYYGGIMIGNQTLSFGELVMFIYLVERFFYPIRDLSEKYNILQASMASSERIFTLLDTESDIVQRSHPVRPEAFKGRIEFDDVSFAYNHPEWVLQNVSFKVEPGEKVAVVGATGAGKTSLVSLLFRFYDNQQGAIRIDGVDVKDYTIDELRAHLGLVLQDVFIFSGNLAGNVRLRNSEISDDEVRSALTRVGFDRFLDRLPGGLKTETRERGATLSTGQKQLVSFARALAFDPDILILDEATSSVDTETEIVIQQALEELLKDRTAIVIAHRLSTIEKADKIVVLHHGTVREMGKHKELLNRKGIYYTLHQLQYKRQDVARAGGVGAANR